MCESAGFIDIEAAMVWKATQEYRKQLAHRLLPLGLVIYGDRGWRSLLDGRHETQTAGAIITGNSPWFTTSQR